MANARLKYTPYPSRGVMMPGTNYLLLEESDNLIGVNPGFETGDTTGWQLTTPPPSAGTFTVTSGSPYAGTYKAQLAFTDLTVGATFASTDTFNLSRGTRYKLIMAHKVSAGTKNIYTYIYDENGLLPIAAPGLASTVTNAWGLSIINFTPDRDYFNCYLAVNIPTGAAITLYFDAFYIAPEYLDMGLDSFSIDLLHQPLTQTGDRRLVNKMYSAGQGYALYFNWTDYKYYFWIHDGTNSVAASSAAVTAIQNQEYHWVRVTVDRTLDKIKFYVNGVQSGSDGDIAAVTGNLSTTQQMRLFAVDSVTQLYKGFCDFIRFQRGTLLDADWMTEEWARIQAGRIRGIPSATALWDFNDDLVDGCQGLILAENTGTATYADGWPYCVAPVTYNFSVNYRHEYRIAPLASDSLVRAFRTGAAYNMVGPRKNSYELPFVGITQAQYSAFLAAYEGGEIVDLWLDSANEQTAKVYFSGPPEMQGIPYFRNGELVVNTTLYLVDS